MTLLEYFDNLDIGVSNLDIGNNHGNSALIIPSKWWVFSAEPLLMKFTTGLKHVKNDPVEVYSLHELKYHSRKLKLKFST